MSDIKPSITPAPAKHRVTRSRVAATALTALVAVGGLTGCSSDKEPEKTSDKAASATTVQAQGGSDDSIPTTAPEITPNVEGHISMTSAESKLLKVGPEEERTYGWNKLVGPTSTQIGEFEVEMLGNVDYLQGNGTFFGFLTYTAPSGDSFGMRMTGTATVDPEGVSALSAGLSVIGGTGVYANVTGEGTFEGSRQAVVGAPIEIDVKLALEGIDT